MGVRTNSTESLPRNVEIVSPIRVLLLILAIVFTVESTIMAVLAAVAPNSPDTLWLSLFDSAVLVAALCPALWILVVRPLRSLVAERGELLARTLTIQEEERSRLARDLHDELGQCQTAVLLGLRAVVNAQSLEQARERAEGVHEMAVGAVDATRRMARGLSPSVLNDFGLAAAADRVCEDVEAASGIHVRRDLRTQGMRFDHAVELAAYRVLQEALTNAVKHSQATRIDVSLTHVDGEISLTVSDNGQGMNQDAPVAHGTGNGLGLAGMRERITLLGGSFGVTTTPARGTTLRATLPAKERTT
ncbi:MAG: sensor histidine kinase [Planctomycetota bacterium]|nr:sensor histidine kinase [Planctomycetota bacterium]